MRRAWVVWIWVVAAAACGNKSSESKPAPAPADEPAATTDASAAATAPTEAAGKLPALAPLVAVDLQPPLDCHEYDFLGWTKDGLSFALQRRYLRDLDADPANADDVWFEVREVYDALTGALTHRFRVRRNPRDFDQVSAAAALWDRAQPEKAWDAFRAAQSWVDAKPTMSPAGGWTLAASGDSKGAGPGVTLAVDRRDRGVYYKGDFITAKTSPTLEIKATRAGKEVRLLRYTWPVGEDLSDVRGPVRGNLRPYWSPAGDRVVWAAFRSTVMETAASTAQRSNLVLGALGRQILVVDRGVGLDQARAVAVLLGQASLPVARVQPRDATLAPIAQSRVLYADASARADAAAIVAALPWPAAVEAMPADHPARDRAELVVELGGADTTKPAAAVERSTFELLGGAIGPSGRDIGRLCRWYTSMQMMRESPTRDEPDDSKLDPEMLRDCSKKLQSLKPAERDAIADCASACGDGEEIPSCFDGFGSPMFPACTPVVDDEGDGEDE